MTIKELTQEARHEEALKKYVLDVPDLMEEIKDLSPDDQKDQIQWAFEDEAEAQGLQPWELTLKYTSTPEEYEAERLKLHKEAAEVLGVEWEEYCEMNNLVVSTKNASLEEAGVFHAARRDQRLSRIDRSTAFTSLVIAPIEI